MGKRITFTSDRGGGDNIWIMNADGSDKQQLTEETFRLLNEPSWSLPMAASSPRASISPPRARSAQARSGSITWAAAMGMSRSSALMKRCRRSWASLSIRPMARAIYYTRNVSPGNTFEYAQDSNGSPVRDPERYEFATGEETTAVSGAGGATRPTPSPDGTKLAFVRRDRNESKLYVKDLATGGLTKGL
jgi:Tol biopolymer transport system component